MSPADLTLEQLSTDAHAQLHDLRATQPVAWVPAIERWLVTERTLVAEALRDADRFTVDDPRFTTAQVVGPSMLSLDGTEHARHRSPFVPPFRRAPTHDRFTGATQAIADRLVSTLPGHGADLRRDLAGPLAAETISLALGLVDTTVDTLLGWYREIVQAVEVVTGGGKPSLDVASAVEALAEAVERTRSTAGTLMAEIDRSGDLSPAELHSNTAVMLFGAIETSEGMTANALYHVLSEPHLVERLRRDPELIGHAVEESLRLEPAATWVDRYTTSETRLGDVVLPERAAIALSLAAANRDPAHFAEPDRFNLDRANAGHHLAFVIGPHACIGMHLARLETAAALGAVLALPDRLFLRDPAGARPTGLVFRKPPALLVGRSAGT